MTAVEMLQLTGGILQGTIPLIKRGRGLFLRD